MKNLYKFKLGKRKNKFIFLALMSAPENASGGKSSVKDRVSKLEDNIVKINQQVQDLTYKKESEEMGFDENGKEIVQDENNLKKEKSGENKKSLQEEINELNKKLAELTSEKNKLESGLKGDSQKAIRAVAGKSMSSTESSSLKLDKENLLAESKALGLSTNQKDDKDNLTDEALQKNLKIRKAKILSVSKETVEGLDPSKYSSNKGTWKEWNKKIAPSLGLKKGASAKEVQGAIKVLQKDLGLEVDGKFGPKTRAAFFRKQNEAKINKSLGIGKDGKFDKSSIFGKQFSEMGKKLKAAKTPVARFKILSESFIKAVKGLGGALKDFKEYAKNPDFQRELMRDIGKRFGMKGKEFNKAINEFKGGEEQSSSAFMDSFEAFSKKYGIPDTPENREDIQGDFIDGTSKIINRFVYGKLGGKMSRDEFIRKMGSDEGFRNKMSKKALEIFKGNDLISEAIRERFQINQENTDRWGKLGKKIQNKEEGVNHASTMMPGPMKNLMKNRSIFTKLDAMMFGKKNMSQDEMFRNFIKMQKDPEYQATVYANLKKGLKTDTTIPVDQKKLILASFKPTNANRQFSGKFAEYLNTEEGKKRFFPMFAKS